MITAELSRLTTVTTRGAERVAAQTPQPSALESFAEAISRNGTAIPRQPVTVGGYLRASEKNAPEDQGANNPWPDLCA